MPTYAQLRSEWFWDAEEMSAEMEWLRREVAAGLGIPLGNVGSKGDNAHLNGGHRSQYWILHSKFCTNRTYTVWGGLPVDLQHCLAAIDITPKSREQMLLISRRLDAATRAGMIEEVVAWYGNTNNDQRVDGWDNIRDVVASSDSSHLWHLHITLNRWAVRLMPVMRRLAAILLGRPIPQPTPPIVTEDDEMLMLAQVAGDPTVRVGNGLYCREVGSPDAVRDLLKAGAYGGWLSGFYGVAGSEPLPSIEALHDRLGVPRP
jgi:hypothetical protein